MTGTAYSYGFAPLQGLFILWTLGKALWLGNSSVDNLYNQKKAEGQPGGKVMTVDFTLNDMHFTALNGGPQFQFNEAISIFSIAIRKKKLTIIGKS